MIEKADITAIIKGVAPVLKELINSAVAEHLVEFDARLHALPVAKDGQPGPQGPPGEGRQGEKGERGERGEDAPPVNVDAIIETLRVRIDGQLREAIAEIPKPQDGRDGRDGRDGIAKDGRDGSPGRDGERGKDALEIEILPAIDLTKSFPRGTFAAHRGGLWRAMKNTEPGQIEKSGWENIVVGKSKLSVHQDQSDPRVFIVEHCLSNGEIELEEFRIPVSIYKGVYREGEDYRQGDQVTWSGSQWHCNADSTKTKPGTSADWQLSVKRGQDGKDAKDVAKEAEPTKPVRLR